MVLVIAKPIFGWLRYLLNQYNLMHNYCFFTRNKKSSPVHWRWNGLPDFAKRKILGQLKICDRARLILVSKSWKRILTGDDIPFDSKHLVPWRPNLRSFCFSADSYLTFIEFQDVEGKVYRFELPKLHGDVRGGWLCGSSNGWLVIATAPKLNPNMFMLNLLNNDVRELPPLSTLSFLPQLLKSGSELYNISRYMKRVHVFSSECVVAVVFSDSDHGGKQDFVAFCTPKDEEWRVLEADYYYPISDILFHDGKLYVLAKHIMDDDGAKDMIRKSTHTVSLSNCQVEVCVLCLNYKVDNPRGDMKSLYNEVDGENSLFNIRYDDKIREHLVELSGELLVMTVVYDLYEYNSNGDGPVKKFRCNQIQRIEVRKVDGLERIDRLVQNVVLAHTGSYAFSGKGGNCCIFFSSYYGRGFVGDGLTGDENDNINQFVVRETGMYYLQNSEMRSYSFTYIDDLSPCKIYLFTPKIS